MLFSEALKKCIGGAKITRRDWNGKNMFVYYVRPHKVFTENWTQDVNTADDLTDSERLRGYVEIAGHFDMYHAQGIRIIGWVASQTDLASNQWEVVE